VIFINYRIKDSIDLVSHLYDYLVRDFGEENVFWDKHNLEAGRWSTQLEEAVRRCPVMLSIIGPEWHKVTFPEGHAKAGFPRLSDPDDWVRKEITLALSLHDSGQRVIPVLLQGRLLPQKEWLANVGLGELWECQPCPLRSAPDFQADYEKLRDSILAACSELRLKTQPGPGEVPPPRRPCHLTYSTLGELFIGREEFLEQLHLKFKAAHAEGRWPKHAVCGVGGLGKTQLAVEYALQYRDQYTAVLMVNADTPESLRSGIAGLAGVLHTDLDPATKDDVKEQLTLDWLRKHPGWLLIVDNADDDMARNAVADRLSQWTDGHVLITARFKKWPHSVEALDLHVLQVDHAARFLMKATEGQRRVATDDVAQARQLAGDDLDGLCLAL
jgi:hypothetical protein